MKLTDILIIIALLTINPFAARAQVMDPRTVAQGQLDAYNNQDIEAFLSWYTDDVEIYNFPDELIYKGKKKMRARYTNAWKQNPGQRAAVTERIVMGSTVIDKEHVTGRANGIEIFVIAVYKTDQGKISKVYFIRD